MSMVRVTFVYEPEDPDTSDPTGVSVEEFDRINDQLGMEFGAQDIQVEQVKA